MEHNPDISNMLDKLQNIALEDGKITSEEESLITAIITNMNAYTSLLRKAEEDNIITPMERTDLFEQRMRVMERSYATARSDKEISKDEGALLHHVCALILEMSKNSKL